MGDADRTPEDYAAMAVTLDGHMPPYRVIDIGAAREAARLLREAQRDVDAAARLRALCGFLIDACATHRIPVPLNSSLLDLAADIASDGGAAVGSVDPEGEAPSIFTTTRADESWTAAERNAPARPSVCPTCDSRSPQYAVTGSECDPWVGSPDPWHSPDTGREA